MNRKSASDVVTGKVVVIAVKASTEIRKNALVWALTHVILPGDFIKLLVVVPSRASVKKTWGFSRFATDCTTGHRKSLPGNRSDQRDAISEMFSQMMAQLHNMYDTDKVKITVQIVSGSGVVAAEAKSIQSNWVILDKHLKHEKKNCMDELDCNVVIIKRHGPKVLRLNLIGSPRMESELAMALRFNRDAFSNDCESKYEKLDTLRGPYVTPASSPERESSLTATEAGTSSLSSSDPGTSPYVLFGTRGNHKKGRPFTVEESQFLYASESEIGSEQPSPAFTKLYFQPWMDDFLSSSGDFSKHLREDSERDHGTAFCSTYKSILDNLLRLDQEPDIGALSNKFDLKFSRSVREAISLSAHVPPDPPPLCSLCRHKAPLLGNPPKWFTYTELEIATDGFSQENFLAEGGFGSVYRGVLQDGQVVAVKQHKLASSQGDLEFCSEVEVLSCAQHRNVVMLIGFCIEDGRRLLVYEYICNGSLDSHLFGHGRDPLEWSARQKIAVGAARGLRYLHEECRVGCIVHRDMRPNNILITHDFEPLVGDFGLARWQPDGDIGVDTRIIGTFGYLAPEYAQSGQVTEKADIYSFGIVLVELVTGRKAIDLSRPKGQHCLSEWARPLLKRFAIHELVDPRLSSFYSEKEVYNMVQCASLCIQRDPHLRPRISQVLRMLEGDIVISSTNNM